MASSTSCSFMKNKKLYDYLEGWETACFTGSTKTQLIKSFENLFISELDILFPEYHEDNLRLRKSISSTCDKYLARFYSESSNEKIRNSSRVERLANLMKEDSKTLSQQVSTLMMGSKSPLLEIGVCPIQGNKVGNCIDLCDKCPYYTGTKMLIYFDTEDLEELDCQLLIFKLTFSKYLSKALFTLFSWLVTNYNVDKNDIIKYHMLFEHILMLSKVYELMNPSNEVRQKMLDSAEELLTQEPIDRESEMYQYFDSILQQVFDDIESAKIRKTRSNRYVHDITDAIIKSKDYINSKYDPELDNYCSLKGTAQSLNTNIKESLISSAYEYDCYKSLFEEFDRYVNFVSFYDDPPEDYPGTIYNIRTILINNPGKFKGRIIHISDNPLQDRCNFIHRRASALLREMRCDSTRDHEIGRNFAKLATLKWYLSSPEDRSGISAFDFSNATDTLDQQFQYRVVEFLFSPEIANFWQKVSELKKHMQSVPLKEGDPVLYHEYDQKCGQPQGLLGSFELFALAHHFIFLMDMKIMGWEEKSASEFYRILGDDSICCTPVPEMGNLYDEDLKFIDKEGIERSELERIHFEICEFFAGFKINYDKSTSCHYFHSEAKVDFAKVTFRNGQLFTPIPIRLAMNFNADRNSPIACAVWRMDRGDALASNFLDTIMSSSDYSDLDRDLIRCGEIPYLEGFEDHRLYNEAWLSRVRYCLALTLLSSALAFSSLSATKRSDPKKSMDHLDEAFQLLFTKKQMIEINNINPNHKVMRIIERNYDIIELLNHIESFKDIDDKYLALACSSIGEEFLRGDFFDILYNLSKTSEIIQIVKSNPNSDIDLSEIFTDFPAVQFKKLKKLSDSTLTFGTTKRPKEVVWIFETISSLLKSLDEVLGPIPRTFEEMNKKE